MGCRTDCFGSLVMHALHYLRWAFLTSLVTALTLAANERERVTFGARGLSRERHAPALLNRPGFSGGCFV